eukprot:2191244-Pleurochrysis_carterae.AAC.1
METGRASEGTKQEIESGDFIHRRTSETPRNRASPALREPSSIPTDTRHEKKGRRDMTRRGRRDTTSRGQNSAARTPRPGASASR